MQSNEIRYGLIMMIWVVVTAVFLGIDKLSPEPMEFHPITGDTILDLLTPLFLIALFLERAQEVFVTTWRGIEATQLKEEFEQAERTKDPDKIAQTRRKMSDYKTQTAQIAFLSGTSMGLLIGLVGVRVLEPLVNHTGLIGWQMVCFKFLDVFLTGALLGGGAEGIHKVVATFTDFLDKSRVKMEQSTKGATTT